MELRKQSIRRNLPMDDGGGAVSRGGLFGVVGE
ncbi:uncharacterized protein G2W53_016531 [Senna tora]|uniref:Uncharacterized protein n=1 Tax=Senna tora TaxID=362788 RepID=A0A834WJL2_9FABA|nr:uncharacterized protein G2W53_016531 [Senna tora]